jgi:hypothetical protein
LWCEDFLWLFFLVVLAMLESGLAAGAASGAVGVGAGGAAGDVGEGGV